MTINEALRLGIQILKKASVEDPARDARILMAASLDISPARLTLYAPDDLKAEAEANYFSDIQKRAQYVPVSHLIGRRTFWGRDFMVNADVLDPRPETETLIAAALEHRFDKILDLGTGTGCILLTLLAENQSAIGIGADLSQPALRIAQKNATNLDLTGRCTFVQSDWFKNIEGCFDLIVSNPPYISLSEMGEVQAELAYEPRLALTDGGDGLGAYRIITAEAPKHLLPGGWLMVEIGSSQGASVLNMMAQAGLESVSIGADFDGRDRVVVGQMPQI